ncbi:MAG: hypothetical protein IJ785_06545 [Bacteroidales bacterium]|nr:hypothetical protein [Bacteroidales bacterium]
MMGKNDNRPTAIYKTKVSIMLYLILYGAAIAVLILPIIKTEVLVVKILCGVAIACILWGASNILRFWNDRIVVSPAHLSITHATKKTRDGKWTEVSKAVISWNDIRDIISHFDTHITSYVSIQKEVFIRLRNGIQYRIDSGLYDVLFLERKLKTHWQRYTSQQ